MFPHKRVHCIGIGGIGISAIAKLLHAQGVMVTGSDMADSDTLQGVIALGIPVSIGESDSAIAAAAEAVIYSEAIPEDNVERTAARAAGKTEMSGGAFLGQLTSQYKTLCVAGTHGKSTTTAMIGTIMEAAGLDPTVVVGSKVPGWQLGNVRLGKGEWLVLEADEYARKFLQYHPQIAVITNIEHDHPDVYATESDMVDAFQQFVSQVSQAGTVVVNVDSPLAEKIKVSAARLTCAVAAEADVVGHDRAVTEGGQTFQLRTKEGELGQIALRLPGRMNVANAVAAIAGVQAAGVSVEVCRTTLATFPGIWRRFEYLGHMKAFDGQESDRPLVISDYGHHPTAVAETISAARETYPDRRVVLVFQPHQRERTRVLKDAFVRSLLLSDSAIVVDIYAVAGRESEADDISSSQLVAEVNALESGKAVLGGSIEESEQQLRNILQPRDVVIVMGAGNVDALARRLVVS